MSELRLVRFTCAQCGKDVECYMADDRPEPMLCERCFESHMLGKWPNLLDGLAEALEEDIEP
jgi:hypothetical protein